VIWLALPALAAAAYQALATVAALRSLVGNRGNGGRDRGGQGPEHWKPAQESNSPLIARPELRSEPGAPAPGPRPLAPASPAPGPRSPAPASLAPVSISLLKPVRGRDPRFYEAIRSHAEQDYPEFEILFGVADGNDPALKDIARLQSEFPHIHIEAVLVSSQAPNAKVGILAELARRARHPLLLVNDSDIRVEPGYLRAVASFFRGAGLLAGNGGPSPPCADPSARPLPGSSVGQTSRSAVDLQVDHRPKAGEKPGREHAPAAPALSPQPPAPVDLGSSPGLRGCEPRPPAPGPWPPVGLVTCLYRARGESAAARFEALGIATEFASSVMTARLLGQAEFALGSTMAFRAETLRAIGGFESIADYLADDYQLGRRIHELGLRIEFAPSIVETDLGAASWAETWRHQVRWSRTIRVSRPGGYFGYAVTHATVWALLAFAAGQWQVGLAALDLRITAGILAAAALHDRPSLRAFWLMPVRDLFGFAVWLAGAFGRTVRWRGRDLILAPDGRIRASGR